MNCLRYLRFRSSPYKHVKRYVSTNGESFIEHLQRRIQISGPLTVAAYMKEALTNPIWGYYMKKDVFGPSGDFITSPEIHQMFGEMVGVWLLNEWLQAKKPPKVHLVELGPGRGTLMADILRVFDQFKLIKSSLSVHLVEVSSKMRSMQSNLICDNSTPTNGDETRESKFGVPVSWHNDIMDIPEGFTLYLAHEFFDALPVHLFKKMDHGWREILVDADSSGLRFVLAPGKSVVAGLIPKHTTLDVYEICPDSGVIAERMSKRIANNGGSSLIIDYGYDNASSNSLRSFRNHELENDILKNPGLADITANVDFSFLKRSAGCKVQKYGPITQAEFLRAMGIDTRYQALLRNANEKQSKDLTSAYDLLLSENKMGQVFKVLAMNQNGSITPAAFENQNKM
eukprot:gene20207-22183_t